MRKVETNKRLGTNQTAGQKNMSTVETATLNEFIIETHRLNRYPLSIIQDYDRIIRGYTIWISRKFGVPDNVCKYHIITHDLMKLRKQRGVKTKERPTHPKTPPSDINSRNYIMVPIISGYLRPNTSASFQTSEIHN